MRNLGKIPENRIRTGSKVSLGIFKIEENFERNRGNIKHLNNAPEIKENSKFDENRQNSKL